MSAIITTPPVLIDPVHFSRMTFTEDGGPQGRINASGGPWIVGSNLYMFLEGGGINTSIDPIQVYKSTNNGSSWIAMDSTSINAPPGNNPGQNSSIYDPISGKIFIAYQGDANTHRFKIYIFNTNTDLYETPSTQSTVDNKGEIFTMARLSNGDIYCYYTFYAFSGNTVYEKLSGGVWSTGTIDASGNGKGVYSVIVDSLDNMTLVYSLDPGGGVNILKSCHIDSTGTIGTPVTMYTNMSAGFGAGFTVGRGVIWNNKLIFPAFIYENPILASTPIIFEGTPIAAPVWSTRTVGNAMSNPPYFNTALDSLLDKDGNLVVGWNQATSPNTVDKIWINTDIGSGFGTQQLFYDAITNPLIYPGVIVESSTHSLYLNQASNGNWYALTAVDVDAYDTSFPCAGIFLGAPEDCPCPLGTVGGRAIRILSSPCDPLSTCSCD